LAARLCRSSRVGVLATCLARIEAGGRLVLDSSTGAQQLADLANAAAHSDSWPEFDAAFLATSKERRACFGRLRDAWGNLAPEAAFQALKRVTVNDVTEEALKGLVVARLTALVDGEPEKAVLALQGLVDSSTHRRLNASDIWACLASHGIGRRRTHWLTPRRWAALAASMAAIIAVIVPPRSQYRTCSSQRRPTRGSGCRCSRSPTGTSSPCKRSRSP
jgi:hypothetical protein